MNSIGSRCLAHLILASFVGLMCTPVCNYVLVFFVDAIMISDLMHNTLESPKQVLRSLKNSNPGLANFCIMGFVLWLL